MKPGARYALRLMLEAALALLTDEDEEEAHEPEPQKVEPEKSLETVKESRRKFFGAALPQEEPKDGREKEA